MFLTLRSLSDKTVSDETVYMHFIRDIVEFRMSNNLDIGQNVEGKKRKQTGKRKRTGKSTSSLPDFTTNQFIALETKRLRLRPFEECDLETLCRYRNDLEVSRYQSWEDYNIEHARKLYEQSCFEFNLPESWYQIAMADISSNIILGDIGVHFLADEQVEIGFSISKEYQNLGYGREAVSAVIKYIFQELKKHRIYAVTDTRNIASAKLLECLRFRQEAHHKENIWFKGEWGSEYVYALLRSEYEAF